MPTDIKRNEEELKKEFYGLKVNPLKADKEIFDLDTLLEVTWNEINRYKDEMNYSQLQGDFEVPKLYWVPRSDKRSDIVPIIRKFAKNLQIFGHRRTNGTLYVGDECNPVLRYYNINDGIDDVSGLIVNHNGLQYRYEFYTEESFKKVSRSYTKKYDDNGDEEHYYFKNTDALNVVVITPSK